MNQLSLLRSLGRSLLRLGSGPSLSVTPLLINSTATGVVAQLSSGLSGVLTFSKVSGTNVTVASNGAVSFGTVLGDGVTRQLVARVDSDSLQFVQQTFTFLGFSAAALSVSGTTPAAGTIGTAYAGSVLGAGGTGPYTYSLFSGTLPAGVTLNASNGVLSGTPTIIATYAAIVIRVTDAAAAQVNLAGFTITIGAALSISGTPPTVGTVGGAYTGAVAAAGGTAPYTYSVFSGTLPAGVTLNASTGAITGTPSTAATSSAIVIRATDAIGGTANLAGFSIVVGNVLSVSGSTPATGTVGTAYAGSITAAGGTAPYTYALFSGTLPPGVTLNASTGALTGSPTNAAAYSPIIIRATDNVGATANTTGFSITVGPALSISGTPPTSGTVGTAYAGSVAGAGGTAPYTYSVFSGTLPAGLTLNASTGAIAGTPTTAATYAAIVIRATDSIGGTANLAGFSVVVGAALSISGTVPTTATFDTAYTGSVGGTGGTGPYAYSVASGPLPAGLSLNTSTGALTGTPTAVATYAGIVLRVTDSTLATADFASTSIVVAAGSMPGATLNTTQISLAA